MGIDPIGYKPWNGERTSKLDRMFIISKTFYIQKLKSWWVRGFLILGLFFLFLISIFAFILLPHDMLDAGVIPLLMGNVFFFIMSILLASLICSDSIAEDFRSNSFVLYFSRAMKTESYLASKFGGTFMALAMFCFLPPVIIAILIVGTQSGPAYGASLGALGYTIIAGFVTTFFFLPLGLLISSMTTRKSYAAVGMFMSIFSLSLIGAIFSDFDSNWILIDTSSLLIIFYDWLFGFGIPNNIDAGLFSVMFSGFIIIPLALLYLRIHMKAVGK